MLPSASATCAAVRISCSRSSSSRRSADANTRRARWSAYSPPACVAPTRASALDGDLLNVDVNLDADADIAAPINGAVAANANVAAPIDAAVAANVGSVDCDATAIAAAGRDHQPGHRRRPREATADQTSQINQ